MGALPSEEPDTPLRWVREGFPTCTAHNGTLKESNLSCPK